MTLDQFTARADFTDAVRAFECPRCCAAVGSNCVDPRGEQTRPSGKPVLFHKRRITKACANADMGIPRRVKLGTMSLMVARVIGEAVVGARVLVDLSATADVRDWCPAIVTAVRDAGGALTLFADRF